MAKPKVEFQAGKIFHIYNHGNGDENLFRSEENFHYFLRKYVEHITMIADTLAYCLLPNHFHFAIRLKSESDIEVLKKVNVVTTEKILSQRFSNFFNGYAKGFNEVYKRKGSLFRETLQRKLVDNPEYLINLITYIHLNPVKHGFVKSADEWKFSSYNSYISDKKTLLSKEDVLKLFKSKERFTEKNNSGYNEKYFLDLQY